LKRLKTTLVLVNISCVITVWLGCVSFAAGAELSDYIYRASNQVYGKVQSYKWTEYRDNGDKFLKESGTFISIGHRLLPKPDSFSFSDNAEIYFGTVEYDGQYADGTSLKDDSDYKGMTVDANVSLPLYKSSSGEQSLLAIGGIGINRWTRSVASGSSDSYDEVWTTLYGRAGLGFYAMKKLYVSGGVKIPMQTKNNVDELGLNLSPKGKTGPFFEASCLLQKVSIGLHYESAKFGKSDEDYSEKYNAPGHQPDSEVEEIGVSIGYFF
jgi:hypothetical protein